MDFEAIPGESVSDEYKGNAIFKEMAMCEEFFDALSDQIWPMLTPTTKVLGNLNSSFLESLAGTMESMRFLLRNGRIADAYTLLRKYNEVSQLHLYVMLLFEERDERVKGVFERMEQLSEDQIFDEVEGIFQQAYYVKDIEDWLSGDKSLPRLRFLSQKILSSPQLNQLNVLFPRTHYKNITNRCNDHVHVNYFHNLRWNSVYIMDEVQISYLEQFASDFRDLIVRHITYFFCIRPDYARSSDYADSLMLGLKPVEGSQFWVATSVQRFFDEFVSPLRPDVTKFIKENSEMKFL